MSENKNDMIRYHAESCIMAKNTSKQYNYMAHRLECICSKVEAFINMKKVTQDMAKIVCIIEKVTVNNLDATINTLEKFEGMSEDLDMQSEKISESISKSMTSTIPSDEVDSLITKVKEEHGLNIAESLNNATPRYFSFFNFLINEKSKSLKDETDELIERLKSIGAPKGESNV